MDPGDMKTFLSEGVQDPVRPPIQQMMTKSFKPAKFEGRSVEVIRTALYLQFKIIQQITRRGG